MLSSKNNQPELFYTLQGEGVSIGSPAIFVRTAGCNLHCFWCDTDYTWNWTGTSFAHQKEEGHDYQKFDKSLRSVKLSVSEICSKILQYPCSHLVITGGEPMLQQKGFVELLEQLNERRPFTAEVETNGTLIPIPDLDAKVQQYNVSPKLENSKNPEALRINESALKWFSESPKAYFKFVLSQESDVAEILKIIDQFLIPKSRVLWMPEGSSVEKLNQNAAWLVPLCQSHGIRFSDRLHIRLVIL